MNLIFQIFWDLRMYEGVGSAYFVIKLFVHGAGDNPLVAVRYANQTPNSVLLYIQRDTFLAAAANLEQIVIVIIFG